MKDNSADTPRAKISSEFRPIAAGASIGHVHLKVADLERAVAFYCDVLGFEVTDRFEDRKGTGTA